MGRKIILDRAAVGQSKQQLRAAQTLFSSGQIQYLQNAESTMGGLSYPSLPGIGDVRAVANQTLQKIKDFGSAFDQYITTIEEFDAKAANSIRQLPLELYWTDFSGWNADPAVLEMHIIDKLVADGMTRAEAEEFMAGVANSLIGLSQSSAYCGDPINMSTGNFIYRKEDITIPGAYPLVFGRFYNAVDKVITTLGPGWTHNFNIWLKEGGNSIQIAFEDGHQEVYRKNADGSYQAPGGRYSTLEKRDDAFVLTTKEKTQYHFTPDGKIEFIRDTNHNKTQFEYKDGLLCGVANASGFFSFAYTQENQLCEVRDHTGRTVGYEYENGCLAYVEQPEGETYRYQYNSEKKLSRIVNPMGVTAITNEYDSAFRATAQLMADGGRLDLHYEDEALSTTAVEQNGNRVTYVRDKDYRTVKVVYANSEERFAYDSDNNRTMFADRNGNVHRFAYDRKGNLTKATDPLNNVTAIAYNRFAKPVQVNNPDGSKVQFGYDENGNLTHRADPLGRLWKFSHNALGLPKHVTLPDSSVNEITYDQRGNITSITDASGAKTTYEYNGLNQVTKSVDAEGHATCFTYNQRGDIIRSTNALGNACAFEYGPGGKLVRTVDYNGNETRLEYNNVNKVERIIDAMGGVTRYTYDLMWNITGVTDPEGNTTRYEFDLDNRMVAAIDPEGGTTRFEHDPNGNITAVVTAGGARTTMEYDAMNRAVRQVEPDGAEILYAYDVVGRLVSATYPNGCQETRAYDKAGQLVAVTNLRGETTRYTYTLLGQVETITNHKGDEVRYEYYPGGRLKSVRKPEGETEQYIWTPGGNVAKRIDALGNETQMTYDALGRVVEIYNPMGGVKRFSYDPMNRVTAATDANGNTTQYRYSPLGVLVEVIDAAGHSTHYSYDAARRLTSVEQARIIDPALGDIQEAEQQLTTYEYNRRGDITAVHAPMGKTAQYTYNADGRLVAKRDEEGFETGYGYTPIGQLEQVQYADGRQVRFTYGELRQLAQVQDWLGTTTIETDPTGQVKQITNPDGQTLGYEWDEIGKRKKLMYPDGSAVEYLHDASGRLAEVRAPSGATRFQYDAAGRLVHREMPGGVETSYLSDSLGRLTQLIHRQGGSELDNLQYQYDMAGNITQIEKHRVGAEADSGLFRYAYDPVNRLVEAAKDGKARQYVYDTLGNRVLATDGADRQLYQYNALNQLVGMQDGESQEEYRYDRRGNLTDVLRDGALQSQYSYDATNMMVKAFSAQNGVAEYTYDGLRNRVAKQELPQSPQALVNGKLQDPAETVRYTVDITRGYNNLMTAETNGSHTQNFVWGNGLLAAEGDSAYTYLQDHLGSPIRLQNGEETTPMAYDEFGVPLVEAGKAMHNPFGFTGYQADEVSSMYYAQARYYRPAAARMAAADTWRGVPGVPQTMNKYAYCINNPVALVDRTGNFPSIADILDAGADLVNDGISTVNGWLESLKPDAPVIQRGIKAGIDFGNWLLSGVSYIARATGIDEDANYNLSDIGATLLMMDKNEETGTYHANFDCWQRHFGYNDIYDTAFGLGTSMDKAKFDFEYNGEEYIFWGWRGDYLNLGAGAELGIYRRMTVGGNPTDHWLVDQELAMPMSLRLKNVDGTEYIAHYPDDPQWWVTGFNPEAQDIPASDLIAIYTMDMSGDVGMYEAFSRAWEGEDKRLVFNPFTYTVTFTFMPKGMENACIV